MKKSAHLVLTGYEMPKIQQSIREIKKYSRNANIEILEKRISSGPKLKSKLWGCEKKNARQKILFASGSMVDLQKLIDVQPKDGIYLQFFLNK